jgi:hypothetical protein
MATSGLPVDDCPIMISERQSLVARWQWVIPALVIVGEQETIIRWWFATVISTIGNDPVGNSQ